MKFEVTHITILTGSGADHLYLHTTLPEGCYPYSGHASVRLEVAAGAGSAYVAEHLPDVPVEVVRTSSR